VVDGGGISTSTDLGATWQQLTAFFGDVDDIEFNPLNHDTMYAVESTGDNSPALFFASRDGGKTWAQKAVLAHPRLPGADVEVDSTNGDVVYVVLGNGLVYQSTNGGNSWRLRSNGLPGTQKGVHGMAIDKENPRVLYTAGYEGVYKTTNGGASWFSTDCGCRVRQISIDPTNDKILYAVGRADAGFDQAVKSIDSGKTWGMLGLPRFEYHPYTAIAVDPRNPNRVFASSETRGIFKSTNSGETWTSSTTGSRIRTFELAADKSRSGHMFALTSGFSRSGATFPPNVVFETIDGGANWHWVTAFDGFDIGLIQVHPKDSKVITAFGKSRLLSTDGGSTWQPRPSLGVVFDPLHPNTSYNYWYTVDKSTDFGKTQKVIKPPLIYNEFITDMAIDSTTGRIIYISTDCATDNDCVGSSRVFKSTDAGETWKDVGGNGLPGTASLWDIEVNPKNSSVVYVTGGGLSKSTNGGQTWSHIDFPESFLSIDPLNPQRILARDLGGRHLFFSQDAGKTWTPFNMTGLLSVGTFGPPDTVVSTAFFSPWTPRVLFAAVDGVKTYTEQ
jgi:photosystem II stability/assembly factor-like uncharacterized protein